MLTLTFFYSSLRKRNRN